MPAPRSSHHTPARDSSGEVRDDPARQPRGPDATDRSRFEPSAAAAEEARGIYSLGARGELKALSKDLGRLDGLYEMSDGTLLATDWNSGSLFSWTPKTGMKTLASGFKGPADFCVVPEAKGFLVVVPDLVESELRMIRLAE
jgi:hypothetical protein